MYSLLIKDRAYPISVYLSHLMQVKGFTRTHAIKTLTLAANELGLREQKTPPANNTVSEWGRSSAVPLWAVITAMKILEQLGKIPYLDKEWAFWAYATAELDLESVKATGKWADWLGKAKHYKQCYAQRGAIRKKFSTLSDSNLASRIVIFSMGNCLSEVTIPQLFFDLDETKNGLALLDERLKYEEPLTNEDVESVIRSNVESANLYKNLLYVIQELTDKGICISHFNGNISITMSG